MHAKKLLWVVEDDPSLVTIYEGLFGSQFDLRWSFSLDEFRTQFLSRTKDPNIIVADLRLQDGLFNDLLNKNSSINLADFKILVVSSWDDLEMMQQLFENGISDFLVKPFSANELIFKLNRILNSSMTASDRALKGFPDPNDRSFTTKESEILKVLIEHHARLLTKAMLMEKVWRGQKVVANVVDVHLTHLRKKLRLLGWSIVCDANQKYSLQPLPVGVDTTTSQNYASSYLGVL